MLLLSYNIFFFYPIKLLVTCFKPKTLWKIYVKTVIALEMFEMYFAVATDRVRQSG